MDRTLKILLGGLAIAALVVGVGFAGSIRSSFHITDLVAQCETETNNPPKYQDTESAAKSHGFDFSSMRYVGCDPEVLRTESRSSPFVGIRAQIIDTLRQGERWFEQAIVIAIGVLILSATPFAWYFLLRRVRELHDAIVGK